MTAYELPDVLRNYDDLARLSCGDLPEMADAQLFAERERVTRALADAIASGSREYVHTLEAPGFDLAVDWLHERARKVTHEIKLRRSGQ